ncbi:MULTISPECIES: heme/hemin ABC transporter substrate-binding protein [Methylomonas]|uniref:ABC transporter substrate-binding protein n=2 Tax=Methylomonas TaxID=416 RepID=A0A140E4A3_9GAMM|nr:MULTISPECIES: hemin ABC transporter substrate-binding protein [Methylomonas]AMK75227.1 ABC transporter substrate-binding protein [Methylomonas denitrificans]OAH99378.1 ABC transporter substrate-binding protein [Methylomonas methanica]TCV85025.1 iron complex transport system substrate-binding protein [Methylomonas methanica]
MPGIQHLLYRLIQPALLFTALSTALPAAAETPARIVSVGGSLTEIVYALDGQASLVGVDTTSFWPEAAKALPQVGYMRALSAEGILSLAPSLVVASAHAGPPAVLDQLRSAGVPLQTVAEEYSEQGIVNKIAAIAAVLGKPAEGERLTAQVEADFGQLAQLRAQITKQPKVLFFMAVSHGAPLVSGRDTAADAIIALAGGSNAANDFSGNKPTGAEAIIAAAPDAILLTELTLHAIGGLEQFYQLPGIAHTPAGQHRRVIVMDTLSLLGFGLRSAQAAMDFSRQLRQVPDVAASSR